MRGFITIFVIIAFHSACTQNESFKQFNKINGVSFVSPPQAIHDSLILLPSKIVNANWLTLMPFAFVRPDSPTLNYNIDWQWWGEKSEGIISMIKMAKSSNYRLMLKPQIWIHHGSFTGHLKFNSERDWTIFEEGYKAYLLTYAKIAEDEQIDILCIGTELETFINERPQFWTELIIEIKKVYSGKLTYASNWDEYAKVSFWNRLDFIGIDAYFPLSDVKNPSVSDLKKRWETIGDELQLFSESQQRPVLFTEYGARSKSGATIEPWQSGREGTVDQEIQSNALKALYEVMWDKEFFSGGFIWKWFANHENSGGVLHNGFTPQNKKAQLVVKKYYKLYSSD